MDLFHRTGLSFTLCPCSLQVSTVSIGQMEAIPASQFGDPGRIAMAPTDLMWVSSRAECFRPTENPPIQVFHHEGKELMCTAKLREPPSECHTPSSSRQPHQHLPPCMVPALSHSCLIMEPLFIFRITLMYVLRQSLLYPRLTSNSSCS